VTTVWAFAIVVATAGAVYASPAPLEVPEARYAPKGMPGHAAVERAGGLQYLYVAAVQAGSRHSAGAGATLLQAAPTLGGTDFHSLAEVAVESGDGKQIVEIGWTVDAGVNGDVQPHLFAYHWVDGQTSCYNGCGWVQMSPTKQPGMAVAPGESHLYEIKLVGSDWWLFFDGEGMGYYPQSLWGGGYTAAGLVQWFGEIAAGETSPCTQMGNGKFGADAASASFVDLHLFDPGGVSAAAAAFAGTITNQALYNMGRVTPASFGFGGPGVTTGCCTAASCTAAGAECGAITDPTCTSNMQDCGACSAPDVCSAEHVCVPADHGGCCDAGASAGSPLALGGLVALRLRRRRRA
jgi:hypothetical protein